MRMHQYIPSIFYVNGLLSLLSKTYHLYKRISEEPVSQPLWSQWKHSPIHKPWKLLEAMRRPLSGVPSLPPNTSIAGHNTSSCLDPWEHRTSPHGWVVVDYRGPSTDSPTWTTPTPTNSSEGYPTQPSLKFVFFCRICTHFPCSMNFNFSWAYNQIIEYIIPFELARTLYAYTLSMNGTQSSLPAPPTHKLRGGI